MSQHFKLDTQLKALRFNYYMYNLCTFLSLFQ
jgi:hypothetical protein